MMIAGTVQRAAPRRRPRTTAKLDGEPSFIAAVAELSEADRSHE